MEAMIKQWAKDKKLDKPIMNVVLNNILAKCNVQAICMSRDIGLPPTIPMPRVRWKSLRLQEEVSLFLPFLFLYLDFLLYYTN